MNKRIKKKRSLVREVQQLRSDMLALSRENLDLYAKLTTFNSELSALRQSQERHETACGKMWKLQMRNLTKSKMI